MAIVQSVIRADTRVKGRAGLVIAEHVFDDGQTWRVVFECGADEAPEKRLADMIPQREAERAASDARKRELDVRASAEAKLDTYTRSLPDTTLAAAGLTAEEIAAIKETEAVRAR